MGVFSIEIGLGDPLGQRWLTVDAIVDTGATFTTVPASTLRELGVEPRMKRRFEFGQGEVKQLDIGLTWVRVDGQETTTPVLFNGEGTTPLLGSVTLEELLLGVDPVGQKLIPIYGYVL
jgi:predicted aspartyl protease